MTSLVTRFRMCCTAAVAVALAACGAPGGASPVPLAQPQPLPSASSADTTTQSVPADGKLSFALAANRGLQGTIAFPLVPGAGGTATLLSSATAVPGLPDLAGPPLAPEPVDYLCVSFSVHQIPLGAPSLGLTASGVAPGPTGVGLAYFQTASNSWNQSYGVAALAPSVMLVARDAVFYRPDRTCFALYLTAVTPLP